MHTHMESALAITMQDKGRLLMADQNACRFYDNISYLDEYGGLGFEDESIKMANAMGINSICY